jgi:hypothetical protein
MSAAALCAICHKRKAKRHCPGVHGEICALCCGTEREVSVDCPLDCVYLRESRRHGADHPDAPPEMPFPDVEVGDRFLHQHEQFIGQVSIRLLRHFLENPLVADNEALEALDQLVRTYQTQQSGIYYESLPENAVAVGVFRDLKKFLDEAQERERRQGGLTTGVPGLAQGAGQLKDGDIIGALVFLARLATVHRNGRPRGRAFLDFLRQTFPEAATPAREESRLIVPGR